ncbi:hypothetical protein FDUTEX481_00644 [Tolypothrix sp. PCC 7601]|nr:hypothetical protein FDUTEX481_00644 [Tolypothrix sp. PCC 7601]
MNGYAYTYPTRGWKHIAVYPTSGIGLSYAYTYPARGWKPSSMTNYFSFICTVTLTLPP